MHIEKEANNHFSDYSFEDDNFNRKNFAKNIFEHILTQGNNTNLIIALNGEWGTGKTMLVKMFSNELKNKCFDNENNKGSFLPIYFDSWKYDSWDEPITTLIKSLKDNGKDFKGIDKYVNSYLSHSLKILGGIGVDILLSKAGINETNKKRILSFKKSVKNEMNKNRLEVSSDFASFIESRDALKKKLEETLINSEYTKAVFFIDELDRCRPTYAIRLLENIKHLFDIPNFIFILSLDFKQLSESMKVVYGNGMDTQGYLSRFFDYKFNITRPNYEEIFETYLPKIKFHYQDDDIYNIIAEFSKHAKQIQMGIRDIIIYINALNSLYQFYEKEFKRGHSYVKFIVHSILLMYKYKHNILYNDMENLIWKLIPRGNILSINKIIDGKTINVIKIKYNGLEKHYYNEQTWSNSWIDILGLDPNSPINLSSEYINLRGNLIKKLADYSPWILIQNIVLVQQKDLISLGEKDVPLVKIILDSLEMVYIDNN